MVNADASSRIVSSSTHVLLGFLWPLSRRQSQKSCDESQPQGPSWLLPIYLFVLLELRTRVFLWTFTSLPFCRPGVTRRRFLIHQRFCWPQLRWYFNSSESRVPGSTPHGQHHRTLLRPGPGSQSDLDLDPDQTWTWVLVPVFPEFLNSVVDKTQMLEC